MPLPFINIGVKFVRGAARVVARTAERIWKLPAETKNELFGDANKVIQDIFQDDVTELIINQVASPLVAASLAQDLEVLIIQEIRRNNHIDTGRLLRDTRVEYRTSGRIDDFELQFLVRFPEKAGVAYGFIVNARHPTPPGFLDVAFNEFTKSNAMQSAIDGWSTQAAIFKLNLNDNRPGPILIQRGQANSNKLLEFLQRGNQ